MPTLHLTTTPDETDDAEAQMRRALRIGTSQGVGERDGASDVRSRRHGGAADVPVTRLAPRRDHPSTAALAAADEALRNERAAREAAEAALAVAQATILTLQTKLAHEEMAHGEAIAVQRQLTQAAEDLQRAYDARQLRTETGRTRRAAPPDRADEPANAPAGDQEPVQWWLPDWRSGARRSE